MWPQAKGRLEPGHLLPEPLDGTSVSVLPNGVRVNVRCPKPPWLWSFVRPPQDTGTMALYADAVLSALHGACRFL